MRSDLRPLTLWLVVILLLGSTATALASPGVPADPPPFVSTVQVADAPLVADAGNSAFVQQGAYVVLHGTSFGGSPPYSYIWQVEAGELEIAHSPTAAIATEGVAEGTYAATLTVTDGAGTTATDTAIYTIAGPGDEIPLFEETVSPDGPGVVDVPLGHTDFAFDVPAGLASLTATLEWTVPTNDYDLRLLDPDGTEAGSSTDFIPDVSESVTVAIPQAGEWTARIERFATVGDPEIRVSATGRTASLDDPRVAVDAGGPYAFLLGEPQVVTGTVTDGEAASTGWDLDLDGVFDRPGDEVVADLPAGRHLVQFEAVSADGHRAKQMTSVLVARSQEELDRLAVPLTVIGLADSGINPYHLEFSAAAYPDPEVLELTRDFTRHPSEYIPGYPTDAVALPISLGQGYFPDHDAYLWDRSGDEADEQGLIDEVLDEVLGPPTPAAGPGDFVQPGQVYWIPGTKIVGAIDAGGFGESVHPILDDNGHGTGSATVAAGNRYGYCPTCLIVMADALSGGTATINQLDWVDISTNSWGTTGGIPLGVLGPNLGVKEAVERGQTVLFSAGNGMANTFFDVPILTHGSDFSGPDWTITVGAIREDSQGAIISDGVPAHVSNLGDGDLPAACRTGDTGQCAHSGTSAASPYTAGVFGTVLTETRRALGDHSSTGQRDGQVIAAGTPVPDSPFLEDGKLTRRELRAAVLKSSEPRYDGEQAGRFYPLPQQWNLEQAHYVFEGYGSPGPATAERAIEVLLGDRPLPDRSEEDAFFLLDCELRDGHYGSYDRTGDGEEDGCEESEAVAFTGTGERANDDPRDTHFDAAREAVAQDEAASEPVTYWLHRRAVHAPTEQGQPPADDPWESGGPCAETHNEMYMDRQNSDGDVDSCFDDRITSTVAAYRPKGIFAAKDALTTPLPAGSGVEVVANVKSQEPAVMELVAVLKATDREIGRSEPVALPTNPLAWTAFELTFQTVRPVAAGEQLSFHFVHLGARGYAYGYEGDHASHVTITPAPQPDEGLEFGVTIDPVANPVPENGVVELSGQVAFTQLGGDPQLAGFHPISTTVQLAVDDPDFLRPRYAALDREAGTWSLAIDIPIGEHTLYVRALRDRYPSQVETVTVGEAIVDKVDKPGKGKGRDNRPVDPPRGPPAPRSAGAASDHLLARTPAGEDRGGPIVVAVALLAAATTWLGRGLRPSVSLRSCCQVWC